MVTAYLSGQIAVVTGTGRSTGKSIALALAEQLNIKSWVYQRRIRSSHSSMILSRNMESLTS